MLTDALRSAISAATTDAPSDGRVVELPQWLTDAADPALLRGVTEVWQAPPLIVLIRADREPVALRWSRGRYEPAEDVPNGVTLRGVRVWG